MRLRMRIQSERYDMGGAAGLNSRGLGLSNRDSEPTLSATSTVGTTATGIE